MLFLISYSLYLGVTDGLDHLAGAATGGAGLVVNAACAATGAADILGRLSRAGRCLIPWVLACDPSARDRLLVGATTHPCLPVQKAAGCRRYLRTALAGDGPAGEDLLKAKARPADPYFTTE